MSHGERWQHQRLWAGGEVLQIHHSKLSGEVKIQFPSLNRLLFTQLGEWRAPSSGRRCPRRCAARTRWLPAPKFSEKFHGTYSAAAVPLRRKAEPVLGVELLAAVPPGPCWDGTKKRGGAAQCCPPRGAALGPARRDAAWRCPAKAWGRAGTVPRGAAPRPARVDACLQRLSRAVVNAA